MVSLAGLSATYPGYLKADQQSTATDINKMKLLDAKTQQAGQAAFGNTIKMFQSQVPGAQPMQQTPSPGQPSVPAQGQQQFQPPGQPPSPGAGGASPPPINGAPPTMQQNGAMDWRQIAQAVAKANPGAPPQVIAAAVTQFLPLMNAQAQMEWKQYALAIQQQRANTQQELGGQRLDIQRGAEQRRTDQGGQRLEQGQQRIDQSATREKRLAASASIRQDQQYQKLELQKQNLERQIQQGDKKQGLAQWRSTVDAQHKRAMEIIQSQAALMPKQERDALLAEQNKNYQQALEGMRTKVGSTTQTGGTAPKEGKTNDRAPQGSDNPAGPPMEILKEGYVTEFNNGESWTLKNGKPEKVK